MYLPIVLVTALILMTVEIVICCNCPKKSWQAVLPTLVSLSTVFMWVFFFCKTRVHHLYSGNHLHRMDCRRVPGLGTVQCLEMDAEQKTITANKEENLL